MADFQYAADPDQPVVKLGKALRSFDGPSVSSLEGLRHLTHATPS